MRLLSRNLAFGAFTSLAFTFGASLTASAQAAARGASVCRPCRIEITQVARLGTGDSEGYIPRLPEGAARDRRGRVILTFGSAGLPKLYAANGQFLRRIGRSGGGPGEFREASKASFDSNDSLFVFDASRQVSVFAPSGEFVRAFRAPDLPARTPLLLPGGRIMGSGTIPTRARAGFGLHIGDIQGRTTLSFALLPNPTPTAPQPRYVIARSIRDSLVWVAWDTEYVLERWTLSGRRVAMHRRSPEWFDLRSGQAHVKGPASVIMAIDEDARGYLWIAARVKSADWANHMPRSTPGEARTATLQWDGLFDSMIEVVDPQSGQPVATARIPELVMAALGDGYFATYAEDRTGDISLGIIRLSLVEGR